jgi:hypothetical protein
MAKDDEGYLSLDDKIEFDFVKELHKMPGKKFKRLFISYLADSGDYNWEGYTEQEVAAIEKFLKDMTEAMQADDQLEGQDAPHSVFGLDWDPSDPNY